jgi:hypothetical protein
MENEILLPPFAKIEAKTEILQYDIQAPEIKADKKINPDAVAEICLMSQSSANVSLKGRYVTDGEFKGVSSDDVLKATAKVKTVVLEHCQSFDKRYEPTVKEIRVEVLDGLTFQKQMKQRLKIVTIDRLSNREVKEVKAVLDEETGEFVFEVNQKITFDMTVNYAIVSSMKIGVTVVYLA